MNISIRSTMVLSILGLLALGILFVVENSKSFQQEPYYKEKVKAAKLAQSAMRFIKQRYFADEIALDNINDPNNTGLIGQQFSAITSGRGSLPVKLSTTNPNFAAMIVQQFKDAGLKEGDGIALCFTGSFPALNIATCAAIETMGLKPTLITSVSSSSWGANSPELTWLDIHQSLYNAGIFSFMPVASSIGGNQDLGRTLSKEGRDLALAAIERNGISVINEGSLEANIKKRMSIFNSDTNADVRLFVNVGGGVASLGGHQNSNTLPSGLLSKIHLEDFTEKRGVMYEMTQAGVPLLNLLRIDRLLTKYKLPRDPVPLPNIGEGQLYTAYKYDLNIVIATTLFFFLIISIVIYYDSKQNQLGTQIIKTND